jgi:hypothetical protein
MEIPMNDEQIISTVAAKLAQASTALKEAADIIRASGGKGYAAMLQSDAELFAELAADLVKA